MASWNSIFGDLEPEPVLGQPASYAAAGREARRLYRSSDEIEREFAGITSSGDLAELQGETADRLVHLIGEVDGSLADLPPVFDELDTIFSRHDDRLIALQQRTSEALALAGARWNAVHDAQADHAAAVGSLNSIQSQLRYLNARGDDPEVLDRVESLERDLWRQQGIVAHRQSWANDAAAELALSRIEYHQLVADELELVTETIDAISRIPLDDLRDPNRLAQFASDVVNGLVDLGREAIAAIIDGVIDLARALTAVAEFALTESLRVLAIELKTILLGLVALGTALLLWLSKRFPPPYTSGDPGGTSTKRTSAEPSRATYAPRGTTDAERGLQAILVALGHTADDDQIFADEFEIIQTGATRYIVVLPGVTDLTRPNYGLDPHTNTVRDLDQYALPSNSSTGTAGNLYALMVMEAMRVNGVPAGADVMLVGHSYGADTALDLAADHRFNGPGGYRVTHAVAAGYDSGPQLPYVPSSTEVLVLQNRFDAAVLVEHAGTPITSAADRFMGGLDRIIERDPLGGIGDIVTAGGAIARTRAPVDQLVPRVVTHEPGHTQIVFTGGTEGAGHHQSNYIEYLVGTTESSVNDFAASVGGAGYGNVGSVSAIDVSVPSR